MVVPTSQVMSAAVLMLAVMWLRLASRSAAASPGGRLVPKVWTILFAIALGVLAVLPATEFGQPTPREKTWRAENPYPGAVTWPRFWQQGWIGPDNDPTARSERRR
jgi:hypothetical protein